ncbi:hypothetical protein [Myroides marinus]|uniref:hypothetical protein n=1 Tax=Myroides marinus TaxID=703342 RepID=UPI002575A929|nr:hypothetical protein [Myroides marinus]MDM1345718.1 hypothetical protein [Myroides marinus]
MEEIDIQELRERYPITKSEITAFSSFEQILGKCSGDYTVLERKERWEYNLNKLEVVDKRLSDYWKYGSDECCNGCVYRDVSTSHWCNLIGLPCMYNPITKMLGMACCGIGKELSIQLDLFED